MLNKNNDAERMMALFAGNGGAHGTHGEPYQNGSGKWEIKKSAKTVREPVTIDLWQRHLDGEEPLGIIPIREDSLCFWGSIDVDDYDGDLIELVRKVKEEKLPLVPCRSKSGGLHLFQFLLDPQPAKAVQTSLKNMAAQLGLPPKTEIFPKQTTINAKRADVGNWIVMPYLGTTYGGKIKEQNGVKPTGAEMSLTEFLRVAYAARVSSKDFPRLAVRPATSPTDADDAALLAGAPVCLVRLALFGVVKGERNETLFNLGVYARKSHPTSWKDKIARLNHVYCKPPLSFEEVNAIVKSLGKKDYAYRMGKGGMCSEGECANACFAAASELPWRITRIARVKNSDPASWTVWVDDAAVEGLTTVEIMDLHRFRSAVREKAMRFLPSLTKVQWESMQVALSTEEIERAEDIGIEATFDVLFEEFLTNRLVGDRPEALLGNKPYENEAEGRFYFTMHGLIRHLNRETSGRAQRSVFDAGYAARQIKRLGGDVLRNSAGRAIPKTIKGRSVRVWWVPSTAVQRMPPAEAAPLPEPKV